MREFMFVLLIIETAMIGVFVSLNTLLFFLFWEAMLIPMYLMIAIWEEHARITHRSNIFSTPSPAVFSFWRRLLPVCPDRQFLYPRIDGAQLQLHLQAWIFLGCALAFAVKVPMFPLHTVAGGALKPQRRGV